MLVNRGTILFYGSQLLSGSVFECGDRGDTLAIEHYIDGKLDGWSRTWYPNGRLCEERYFVNGQREGVHQGYWPRGTLKFRYHYKNDLMDGVAEEWFESRAQYSRMNYVEGHESGLQTVWRFDGGLFANYVVKNGRKYGLTGVKNCKNVWDTTKSRG